MRHQLEMFLPKLSISAEFIHFGPQGPGKKFCRRAHHEAREHIPACENDWTKGRRRSIVQSCGWLQAGSAGAWSLRRRAVPEPVGVGGVLSLRFPSELMERTPDAGGWVWH